MTEIERTADKPISFAGTLLNRYRHVCAFVDSREEEHRLIDPFVREGLEQGEKALYFVDPEKSADYVLHFQNAGLDMATLLAQGQFDLRTWSEAQLRGGRFEMPAMLSMIEEALSEAAPQGFPRTRFVAEMAWAATGSPGVSDLIEHEARVNYISPRFKDPLICVYDTAKFGGDVVIDVLRTHPMALVGGVLYENPFFVPPDEFLDELRQRGPNAEDG
jgi:hypothetical protein